MRSSCSAVGCSRSTGILTVVVGLNEKVVVLKIAVSVSKINDDVRCDDGTKKEAAVVSKHVY